MFQTQCKSLKIQRWIRAHTNPHSHRQLCGDNTRELMFKYNAASVMLELRIGVLCELRRVSKWPQGSWKAFWGTDCWTLMNRWELTRQVWKKAWLKDEIAPVKAQSQKAIGRKSLRKDWDRKTSGYMEEDEWGKEDEWGRGGPGWALSARLNCLVEGKPLKNLKQNYSDLLL